MKQNPISYCFEKERVRSVLKAAESPSEIKQIHEHSTQICEEGL